MAIPRRLCVTPKLVYKPRNLGTEVAYGELLEWLNEQPEIDLPLRTLKIVDRQDYGWVEFAAAQDCEDEEAVEGYYKRIGMLLCLLRVLSGTDFHIDNIIAACLESTSNGSIFALISVISSIAQATPA